jgi:hypothetical protein
MTERKEGYVLIKIQCELNSMAAWCECWNIQINEDKTPATYFSHWNRPPDSLLTLNGRNIPFVNSVKYLGVIFDKRITWRLHIKRIKPKALRTFIRIYSLFESQWLSTNIKFTLHKALIRSVTIYGCPAWKFAADPTYSNCSACKIRFSIPLAIFRGTHRFTICMWLSKFCTFTIT